MQLHLNLAMLWRKKRKKKLGKIVPRDICISMAASEFYFEQRGTVEFFFKVIDMNFLTNLYEFQINFHCVNFIVVKKRMVGYSNGARLLALPWRRPHAPQNASRSHMYMLDFEICLRPQHRNFLYDFYYFS